LTSWRAARPNSWSRWLYPSRFIARPNQPRYFFREVHELLQRSYELVAAIPYSAATPMPLIIGERVKSFPADRLLLSVYQRKR
jgi:hypothetical protein